MKDPTISPIVIGGVDTHKELHVAAVVDAHDVVIGTESFSTTRAGYRALLPWLRSFGDIARVAVAVPGPSGSGLMRLRAPAGSHLLGVPSRGHAAAPTTSAMRRAFGF